MIDNRPTLPTCEHGPAVSELRENVRELREDVGRRARGDRPASGLIGAVAELREDFGEAADRTIAGHRGTGMRGAFSEALVILDRLSTSFEAHRTALDADRANRDAWGRRLIAALGIVATIAGLIATVRGLLPH